MSASRKCARVMAFDADAYIHLLDDIVLPHDRKVAIMEQVSLILQSSVDRAWGRSPEQILLGTTRNRIIARGTDALDSEPTLTSTFNDAADGDAAGKWIP